MAKGQMAGYYLLGISFYIENKFLYTHYKAILLYKDRV